jgi:PKD repeat protein
VKRTYILNPYYHNMKNLFTLLGIFLFLSISPVKAQPGHGGAPPSFNIKGISAEYEVRELIKPQLESIRLEDEQRDKNGYFYRNGVSVPVNANLNNSGTWTDLSNGDRIWRLKLHAPDALAIGVYYNHFWLPPGARLFLYNEKKNQVIGSFTESNNPESGYFATELIQGESVTLEMYEPSRTHGRSMISISEIAYVYRGIHSHFSDTNKNYGDSDGTCEVNIKCPEGSNWQDEKKGIARIYLKAGTGFGWCSGSLMNNVRKDCTPYFLTADHCGASATPADLTQWVFYFNYEAPTCTYTGTEPGNNSLTGCTLKANGGNGGNNGSDFFLVQLTTAPAFNPYFNGWDCNNTASASGVSIHHPSGDIQKISTYTSALISSTWGSVPDSHWEVVWAATTSGHGITEGGSSGSPIFNGSGHIVGTLTGGSSTCAAPTGPDKYGKFSYSWDQNGTTPPMRLKDWLDPDNTGATTLDGFYCGGPTALTADFTANLTMIPVGGTVDFTDLTSGSPTTWNWTFNGGTPGTANIQNPAGIQYNAAGQYTVSLTASDGTNTDAETKTNYIIVGDPPPVEAPCDTLQFPLPGQLVLYSIRYQNGAYGYISGNNGYSDKAKADYFVPAAPYTNLIGAYLKFGKGTKTSSSTENIVFAAWDNTGPGNSPGATPIATDTLPLSTIVSQAHGHQFTYIEFQTPVNITGAFFLGVYLPSTIGDTLALMTNKNGQTMPGTAWEQWQSGNWYPYYDTISWQYNLSHAIFPVLCRPDLSVEDLNDPSGVIVYPNPANTDITVDFGLALNDNFDIKVYNLIGELVGTYKYKGIPTHTFRVDLSKNPSGIYFLIINSGNILVTRKVSLIK